MLAAANVNDVDVVSIAMSPAEASSIPSRSAVEATDVILNGRNAGICSMLILPEVVNCTRADGTALVENGWFRYGPSLLVM